VIEDATGFVVDHRVVDNGVLDQDLVVPVMRELQERYEGKIKRRLLRPRLSHTGDQRHWRPSCGRRALLARGQRRVVNKKEGPWPFRKARQKHPGVESEIGALQSATA